MSNGNGIKHIADQVRGHVKQPRVAKSNRMIVAAEPQYSRFQKYCQSKGMSASSVIDSLIEAFMKEVGDDVQEPSEAQDKTAG